MVEITVFPLFRQSHYGVLAAGTLEGTHPGSVFVDDEANPRAGLICTRVGYYFLAGEPSAAFLDRLYTAFTVDFVPRQEAELKSPEVLLFFDPPAWREPLFSRFAALRPVLIHKKRHIFPPNHSLSGWETKIPAGLRVVPVTPELLAAQPDQAGEAALFYGSPEAFLRHSLGFCVVDGETVASACTGVFVGGGEIEISIHTAEAYRRRGLAYLAAAAFIEASRQRGLNPIWGCWPENLPSMQLARKLGFVEDANQPVCLWVDSPDWNPSQ
jgi:GNAT superfamily N-acetyltransferase